MILLQHLVERNVHSGMFKDFKTKGQMDFGGCYSSVLSLIFSKDFTWLSHENAELDETECITKKNCGDKCDSDMVTDWCPENCIITEWSQWSACKVTCYPLTQDKLKWSGFTPEHRKSQQQLKFIQIQPCQPPVVDISRNRYR